MRRRSRRFWANLPLRAVTALLAAAAPACRDSAPPPPENKPILRVAAAFGPFSQPLTEEYRRTLPHIQVESAEAPNSVDTIRAIREGTADLGVAFANDTYEGYWAGVKAGTGREIRGVALVQPLSQFVLARKGSGIRTVADLNGKVVAMGPPGSSATTLGKLVLEAFDAKPSETKITSRAGAAEGLINRTIDAAFLPGYVYPDDVMAPALKDGAYLLPIEGPAVERLRQQNPFVRVTTIPRSIVPGQTGMIPSVGLDMIVVCAADVPESVIYDAARQLFIAFPRLSGVEAALRFVNFEEAAATPIPLHPGAARYFRERELSR